MSADSGESRGTNLHACPRLTSPFYPPCARAPGAINESTKHSHIAFDRYGLHTCHERRSAIAYAHCQRWSRLCGQIRKQSTVSPRASQRVAWLLDWSRSRIDDSRTGNSLRAGHTRRELTVTGDTGFQFDAEMFIRAGVWLAFHFGRAGL